MSVSRAPMMLRRKGNIAAQDRRCCKYGCCGGSVDYRSPRHARHAARTREKRGWLNEAAQSRGN